MWSEENKNAIKKQSGTGDGSQSSGAAIAKVYQTNFVIINYLENTKKADEVVAEIISDGGQAIAIACDVRDEKQ